MADFNELPEECITSIFAFTTPADACRFAPVSAAFRSATESDIIWDRFLPSDCNLIVARSEDGEALLDEFPTKKQLYMRLADRPLQIDGASKSFWLDKPSGSKCSMLSARSISIVWGDTSRYWTWTSMPESRFPEVAHLLDVCWFEIRGRIENSILSPETRYAAFLVFKISEDNYEMDIVFKGTITTAGGETDIQHVSLLSDEELSRRTRRNRRRDTSGDPRVDQFPRRRPDGWQEVKLGEFFIHPGEEGSVEVSLESVNSGNWKRGLIIEGFEARPAQT